MRRALLLLLLPVFLLADEVYFSPRGQVRDEILKRINHTHTTLDLAMYSLTSREIAAALNEAARRGVQVRIVRDISQTKEKNDADPFFSAPHLEVRLLKGLGRGIMHDKFAIFDGKEGFTGSYNWTENAEMDNHENALFFSDPRILSAYEKEFSRLWEEARPLAQQGRPAPGGFFHAHPALSLFALFVILLALAAAFTT